MPKIEPGSFPIPTERDATVRIGDRTVTLTNLHKVFRLRRRVLHPDVITAEYRIAKRPAGRVLALEHREYDDGAE